MEQHHPFFHRAYIINTQYCKSTLKQKVTLLFIQEGGMIESHFWIKIPLKLDNQVIQIKTLVCDSECPYDIVLGCTSLAQLSAWQDYASRQLYIQQISIP